MLGGRPQQQLEKTQAARQQVAKAAEAAEAEAAEAEGVALGQKSYAAHREHRHLPYF